MSASEYNVKIVLVALAVSSTISLVRGVELPFAGPDFRRDYLGEHDNHIVPRQGPSEVWRGWKPLRITNRCPDTLWPAILTQQGVGPGTGGFELGSGQAANLWVSPTWGGRVWGRTNCTVEGNSASCGTGDCFMKLQCEFAGNLPATLAEFTLAGGITHSQTFYDISLVDGYNLPMAIKYIPARNTSFIPPNLTNLACIATPGYLTQGSASGLAYSNSTYPIPWESWTTDAYLRNWCPWNLLAEPPTGPSDGVYAYPNDQEIMRPYFSPCLSSCGRYGLDRDCCAGPYSQPHLCSPGQYSVRAKAVCPDAYSYAYDDQYSTFIIPAGGGWEVMFCPEGRSTNILRILGDQLFELATTGRLPAGGVQGPLPGPPNAEGGPPNTGYPVMGNGNLGRPVAFSPVAEHTVKHGSKGNQNSAARELRPTSARGVAYALAPVGVMLLLYR